MAKIIKKGSGIARHYRSATSAGNTQQKERFVKPSLTVPDENMSVRTILERYASGTLNDVALSRQMDYTQDLPDLRGLDISQIHEMKAEINAQVENIEGELKKRKAASKVQEAVIIPEEKFEINPENPKP